MNLVRENNYLTPPCKANSSAKTPAATPTGMDCGTRWRGRARLRAGDYTGCRMKVMIALGGHWDLTNLPCSQTGMNFSRSWRLRTTTAILPSELRAAVAMKSSLLEVQTMRLAPGRMKRENWPKT